MTPDLREAYERDKAFRATAIGNLFAQFEGAHSRYWSLDGRATEAESISDRRLNEADAKAKAARTAFVEMLQATLATSQCPACKGEKGFMDTTYDRTGAWEPCINCHGFGTVFDVKRLHAAIEVKP